MRVCNLIIASAAVLGVIAANGQAQDTGRRFNLRVSRVAQTNNLDKIDVFGSDKADFYTRMWIDGKEVGKTKVVSTDDGPVNWAWHLSTVNRYVSIKIRLMDDDGGLENQDDQVDINPMPNKKDLELTLDTETGRITGDMTGNRGMLMHAAGEGDDMRGQLWFTIE
jgi:hypothetical protein